MKIWENRLFLDDTEKIREFFTGKSDSLLILGLGFDFRACAMAELLKSATNEFSVLLVDYNDRRINDDPHRSQSKANYERINEICSGNRIEELKVPLYVGSDRILAISESVRTKFTAERLSSYRNILIDISAMPRGVAFSIIKRILEIKGESRKLYILTCENSEFDDKIKPVIPEGSAEYLPGFNTFSMTMESDTNEKIIWLPALGMNEANAFNTINDFLHPVEICPVVPFPSMDARRGENILRSYGQQIFRTAGVEKRNIIYVPENNPMLVYSKLYETVIYYEKALDFSEEPGQIIKYAFSSQSSKLIDIGLLLAVINLNKEGKRTGIVVLRNQGYRPESGYDNTKDRLYCLCLDDDVFDW